MSKPYRYETAEKLMASILSDLRILAGTEVGPSGVSWQDVAGTCSVNLRCLASQLDEARAGNSITKPVSFPSPDEYDGPPDGDEWSGGFSDNH